MTHIPSHIICHTAGEELGLFWMKVNRGSVATTAFRYRRENAIEQYGLTEHQADKLGEHVQKWLDKIYREFEKHGIPVHEHEPLPENFNPDPVDVAEGP